MTSINGLRSNSSHAFRADNEPQSSEDMAFLREFFKTHYYQLDSVQSSRAWQKVIKLWPMDSSSSNAIKDLEDFSLFKLINWLFNIKEIEYLRAQSYALQIDPEASKIINELIDNLDCKELVDLISIIAEGSNLPYYNLPYLVKMVAMLPDEINEKIISKVPNDKFFDLMKENFGLVGQEILIKSSPKILTLIIDKLKAAKLEELMNIVQPKGYHTYSNCHNITSLKVFKHAPFENQKLIIENLDSDQLLKILQQNDPVFQENPANFVGEVLFRYRGDFHEELKRSDIEITQLAIKKLGFRNLVPFLALSRGNDYLADFLVVDCVFSKSPRIVQEMILDELNLKHDPSVEKKLLSSCTTQREIR